MEKKSVAPGTKLDIRPDSTLGEKDFSLKSTYEKKVSDTYFLISAPLKNGAIYFIDPKDKIVIQCTENEVKYTVEGYVEEYIKKGMRTYLNVHKTTPWNSFIERRDERIKVDTLIKIEKKYWTPDGEAQVERLDARTLDISNGGVAVYVNAKAEVGEIVELIFPKMKGMTELSIRGETCWIREAERGNAFKYILGLRFFLTHKNEKELVGKLIGLMTQRVKS